MSQDMLILKINQSGHIEYSRTLPAANSIFATVLQVFSTYFANILTRKTKKMTGKKRKPGWAWEGRATFWHKSSPKAE